MIFALQASAEDDSFILAIYLTGILKALGSLDFGMRSDIAAIQGKPRDLSIIGSCLVKSYTLNIERNTSLCVFIQRGLSAITIRSFSHPNI